MKGIRSQRRRRVICLHEYSTSLCFCCKALRVLGERWLKVSKHSSRVPARRCNKTVFTVSVPELMRLNGELSLSVETRRISCSENPQKFKTQPLEIDEIRKVTASDRKMIFDRKCKDFLSGKSFFRRLFSVRKTVWRVWMSEVALHTWGEHRGFELLSWSLMDEHKD